MKWRGDKVIMSNSSQHATCYRKRQCRSFKVTVLLPYQVLPDVIVSNTPHAVMVYYYHNGWLQDYWKPTGQNTWHSLRYFLINSCAFNHCRIAHKIISSGATNAINAIRTRCEMTLVHLSSGPGIFGWTATQMHKRIVAMQLQIKLQIVLPVVTANSFGFHLVIELNIQLWSSSHDGARRSIVEIGNALALRTLR